MQKLHERFPQYNWNQNKGYGTLKHRKSIEMHGVNEYHRKSFRLLPD
jgi:ribonuclease HII